MKHDEDEKNSLKLMLFFAFVKLILEQGSSYNAVNTVANEMALKIEFSGFT